ncbi:hypothetical protein HJC23_012962 [Cyclotella cryptica]|uniref:DNA-directed primase/polymerase protein n=1 Tax=Cyclotella cryptica TaxID=29204 RepID=A0ABD3QGF4_9STRA
MKNETKPRREQNRNTAGINPKSFHKKKRSDNEISHTEKYIDDLLLQASNNEVVLKRKNFTQIQNIRLEAFAEVTSFRIFPLQSLAMEFLDEMMKDYLGEALQSCQSRFNNKTEVTEEQNTKLEQDSDSNGLHRSEFTTSSSDSYSCKRRKIDYDPDMNKLRDKFIDDCIREIKYNPLKSHPNVTKFDFLPPLWSLEPRIFALETASSGKRKYIVGNLGRFLDHYWRKSDPLNRHYYELIRENTPCRLYFDLEYCKKANAHISNTDSEVLMTEFIEELRSQFLAVYNITLTRSCVVDLDSSTSKKFSRHLIIHLPNGELFADAQSAGYFTKQFVSRLADELGSGILVERHPTLAKHLFVNSTPGKAEETPVTRDVDNNTNPTKMTCFVDLGVYTRNRLFRLLGSSKFGKPASAALRIAEANEFQFPLEFGNANFYISSLSTMTTVVPPNLSDHEKFCRAMQWDKHAIALSQTFVVPANASKTNFPILSLCTKINDSTDANDVALTSRSKPLSTYIIANRTPSTSVKSSGESPMPKLDEYILSTLGRRGGAQGRIRAWSIEQVNVGVFYLTYQMCDNRWCERIGRQHKSNNIMWTVDLKHKTCWQSCHDSDCRGFRSREMKLANLADEIVSEIDEFIFDRELEQLNVKQVINQANATQDASGNEFDDEEFDEDLQNLEIPYMASVDATGPHT